jgi:hypothetical protein
MNIFMRTSENAVTHDLDLRRIPLPRTPVNKRGNSTPVKLGRRSRYASL